MGGQGPSIPPSSFFPFSSICLFLNERLCNRLLISPLIRVYLTYWSLVPFASSGSFSLASASLSGVSRLSSTASYAPSPIHHYRNIRKYPLIALNSVLRWLCVEQTICRIGAFVAVGLGWLCGARRVRRLPLHQYHIARTRTTRSSPLHCRCAITRTSQLLRVDQQRRGPNGIARRGRPAAPLTQAQ